MIDPPDETVELATPKRSRWPLALGAFAAILVTAVMAFAIFEPIQVLPRIRLAPGFSMTDQNGQTVTSEDLRGSVVLYTFTYAGCEEPCGSPEPTVAAIRDRLDEVNLGDTDLRFITVSFDPDSDDAAALTARADAFGADGDTWLYATPDLDRAKDIIGSGFRAWYEPRDDGTFAFDPVLTLVDGWGVVRAEYRYQALADDADRIVRHINVLGEELRNSHGANSIAYEAAHFFLCYP